MTFRELAESQGLFVTNDEKVYFEYNSTVQNFAEFMRQNGIDVSVHPWIDRDKTTYMVEETKDAKTFQ